MFLSAMIVDTSPNQPGRQWFGDLYRIHQRLWMGFAASERIESDPFFLDVWESPAGQKNQQRSFLFRVETDGSSRILVQSCRKPNWEWAFQNALGLLRENPRVREYEPAFKANQHLRFRLRANPVKRINQTSKRVGLTDDKSRTEWLVRKSSGSGFEIISARVAECARQIARKNGRTLSHETVLYEGVLKVLEPDKFQAAVTRGIGPAKAFGCGLLSVMSV